MPKGPKGALRGPRVPKGPKGVQRGPREAPGSPMAAQGAPLSTASADATGTLLRGPVVPEGPECRRAEGPGGPKAPEGRRGLGASFLDTGGLTFIQCSAIAFTNQSYKNSGLTLLTFLRCSRAADLHLQSLPLALRIVKCQ